MLVSIRHTAVKVCRPNSERFKGAAKFTGTVTYTVIGTVASDLRAFQTFAAVERAPDALPQFRNEWRVVPLQHLDRDRHELCDVVGIHATRQRVHAECVTEAMRVRVGDSSALIRS
jgi:hypothetical protein